MTGFGEANAEVAEGAEESKATANAEVAKDAKKRKGRRTRRSLRVGQLQGNV